MIFILDIDIEFCGWKILLFWFSGILTNVSTRRDNWISTQISILSSLATPLHHNMENSWNLWRRKYTEIKLCNFCITLFLVVLLSCRSPWLPSLSSSHFLVVKDEAVENVSLKFSSSVEWSWKRKAHWWNKVSRLHKLAYEYLIQSTILEFSL